MNAWHPASAVITGGASGIGLAIARQLSQNGMQIMLADLPGDRLEQAAGSLGALSYALDVSSQEQVEALAQQAFDRFGHVDLLLNNAGVGGPRGRLWDIDSNEARAHFDINYWGVWNGCKAFAPPMIAQDRACAIYNTASENALLCAAPHMGTYIAAKHAVLGLTESFREDLPTPQVHTGVIIPGWVNTAIGPEAIMAHGMDAAKYAQITVPQILARERFVVSHISNLRRINERFDPLFAAYEKYAPRDEGENAYDVRDVFDAQ